MFNGFGYLNYSQKYVQADLKWNSARINIDLSGKLRGTKPMTQEAYSGILPSKWSAVGSITYNANHRLFFGASAEYSSEREGYFLSGIHADTFNKVIIPSYIDLGFNARFDFSDSFSLWARVNNLLNNNVQRILGHAYDGVFVTGGICFNF